MRSGSRVAELHVQQLKISAGSAQGLKTIVTSCVPASSPKAASVSNCGERVGNLQRGGRGRRSFLVRSRQSIRLPEQHAGQACALPRNRSDPGRQQQQRACHVATGEQTHEDHCVGEDSPEGEVIAECHVRAVLNGTPTLRSIMYVNVKVSSATIPSG